MPAPERLFRGDEVNQICDYRANISAALEQLKAAQAERATSLESARAHQEQQLKELEAQLHSLR